MGRRLRQGLFFALLALACAAPVRADPLLMFLFGMAREMMYEGFVNSQKPRSPYDEPLPAVYPGTMVEPAKLRQLIDESFIYLSERRRAELFQAFNDELIKPQNAPVRAAMIQYFSEHAYAVRMVMERLSKLHESEMRELAERFVDQARTLPEKDREQLRLVLNEGLLPVPPDLNKILVVAMRDLPPAALPDATAVADGKPGNAPGAKPQAPARQGPRDPRAAAKPETETAAAAQAPAPAPSLY